MADSGSTITSHPRPLSPHLQIYRPQISSVLSIAHRASGVFLALGSGVLALWLWAAAYHPDCFATLNHYAAAPVGMAVLFAWSQAYFYHLANGIRHMFWDVGLGFTIPVMTRSGIVVVLLSILTNALVWFCVFSMKGLI